MATFAQILDGNGRIPGTSYPNGFNIGNKKPIDTRTIVATKAARNNLRHTYPTMVVWVLGTKITATGKDIYPNAVRYRCLVDVEPNYSGPTTTDADWKDDMSFTVAGGYIGQWDASFNSPNINAASFKSALIAGDYLLVSTAGIGSVDGLPDNNYSVNDRLHWNGVNFDYFPSVVPVLGTPLYYDNEGGIFNSDIIDLIRENWGKDFAAGDHFVGDVVIKHYEVQPPESNGMVVPAIVYADVFRAKEDSNQSDGALPTTKPWINTKWELISTNNPDKLGGSANVDDTAGTTPAAGVYAPTETQKTIKTTLSVFEIEGRIKQAVTTAQRSATIQGGDAATFLTADLTEVPQN